MSEISQANAEQIMDQQTVYVALKFDRAGYTITHRRFFTDKRDLNTVPASWLTTTL